MLNWRTKWRSYWRTNWRGYWQAASLRAESHPFVQHRRARPRAARPLLVPCQRKAARSWGERYEHDHPYSHRAGRKDPYTTALTPTPQKKSPIRTRHGTESRTAHASRADVLLLKCIQALLRYKSTRPPRAAPCVSDLSMICQSRSTRAGSSHCQRLRRPRTSSTSARASSGSGHSHRQYVADPSCQHSVFKRPARPNYTSESPCPVSSKRRASSKASRTCWRNPSIRSAPRRRRGHDATCDAVETPATPRPRPHGEPSPAPGTQRS
jgi:hypothetical protein